MSSPYFLLKTAIEYHFNKKDKEIMSSQEFLSNIFRRNTVDDPGD